MVTASMTLTRGYVASPGLSSTTNRILKSSLDVSSRSALWRSNPGFFCRELCLKTYSCELHTVVNCTANRSPLDTSTPPRHSLPLLGQNGGLPRPNGNGRGRRSRVKAVLEEASSQSTTEGQIAVAWVSDQGKREEMEDELIVVEDAPHGFVFAGIFDGHAGKAASKFLKEKLYSECLEALDGGKALDSFSHTDDGDNDNGTSKIKEALTKAFYETDSKLLAFQEEQTLEDDRNAGSTASAVFVRRDRLVVAHAGDSRAILCTGGETQELCQDHRISGDSDMAIAEITRIKNAGGWISKGRVCGFLAVSRAFGDSIYKTNRKAFLLEGIKKGRWTKRFVDKLKIEEEWVTPRPDVMCVELTSDAEFVMLASDGLWDAVRSTEAVKFIRTKLKEHGDIKVASNMLVQFAISERKGDDNVSLVVIQLKPSLT